MIKSLTDQSASPIAPVCITHHLHVTNFPHLSSLMPSVRVPGFRFPQGIPSQRSSVIQGYSGLFSLPHPAAPSARQHSNQPNGLLYCGMVRLSFPAPPAVRSPGYPRSTHSRSHRPASLYQGETGETGEAHTSSSHHALSHIRSAVTSLAINTDLKKH